MLILAHRGCHAELPENTLAAFEAAVNRGADGIETDVQATRDGVPILFHDTTVQGQAVAGMTHAELCHRSQVEVPTLVSALDAWPDILWNVEVKMPTNPAAVWPILREYRQKRRMLVSSFWHPVAVQAGREFGFDCGLLVAHRPLSFTSLLVGLPEDLPTSRVAVVWEYNGVDETLVQSARAAGVKSYVYGPRTSSDHATCSGWELDGIITDQVTFPSQKIIQSGWQETRGQR